MSKTETKPCLECGTACAAAATTCCQCGGGSFQHVLDQQVQDAATLAAREAGEPDPEARQSLDDLPTTREEAEARFAAGWRPDSMCAECPSLERPCKACWVRAGYAADAYDRPDPDAATLPLAGAGALVLPLQTAEPGDALPPLPEGAYGPDSLPVPRHPDLGSDGEDSALSSPSDDVPEDHLPAPPAVPVIASPPSDPNEPPGAHDGDDAGPSTQPEPDASVAPADPTSSGPSTVTTADETPKAKGQRSSSSRKGGGR